MSNSDKEFEEWCKNEGITIWSQWTRVGALRAWNHLYPYKERCEELEKFIDSIMCSTREDFIEKIQTLEALLIDACDCMDRLLGDAPLNKLECRNFLNKPEIKKLLEGGKE